MHSLYMNEKDEVIYRILLDFFSAIKETFPIEWSSGSQLTKTTGFYGFMKFFIDIAKIAKFKDTTINKKYFLEFFSRVKNDFTTFTSKEYNPGAVGQNKIRDILRSGLTEEEREIIGIK